MLANVYKEELEIISKIFQEKYHHLKDSIKNSLVNEKDINKIQELQMAYKNLNIVWNKICFYEDNLEFLDLDLGEINKEFEEIRNICKSYICAETKPYTIAHRIQNKNKN